MPLSRQPLSPLWRTTQTTQLWSTPEISHLIHFKTEVCKKKQLVLKYFPALALSWEASCRTTYPGVVQIPTPSPPKRTWGPCLLHPSTHDSGCESLLSQVLQAPTSLHLCREATTNPFHQFQTSHHKGRESQTYRLHLIKSVSPSLLVITT